MRSPNDGAQREAPPAQSSQAGALASVRVACTCLWPDQTCLRSCATGATRVAGVAVAAAVDAVALARAVVGAARLAAAVVALEAGVAEAGPMPADAVPGACVALAVVGGAVQRIRRVGPARRHI